MKLYRPCLSCNKRRLGCSVGCIEYKKFIDKLHQRVEKEIPRTNMIKRLRGGNEMKLSEVIAKLEEDPNKIFKSTTYLDFENKPVACVEDGTIVFKYMPGEEPMKRIALNRKWEEVEQPVSFLEAVKAFSQGKKILCEHGGMNYEFEASWTNLELEPEEILEGKWYILD